MLLHNTAHPGLSSGMEIFYFLYIKGEVNVLRTKMDAWKVILHFLPFSYIFITLSKTIIFSREWIAGNRIWMPLGAEALSLGDRCRPLCSDLSCAPCSLLLCNFWVYNWIRYHLYSLLKTLICFPWLSSQPKTNTLVFIWLLCSL